MSPWRRDGLQQDGRDGRSKSQTDTLGLGSRRRDRSLERSRVLRVERGTCIPRVRPGRVGKRESNASTSEQVLGCRFVDSRDGTHGKVIRFLHVEPVVTIVVVVIIVIIVVRHRVLGRCCVGWRGVRGEGQVIGLARTEWVDGGCCAACVDVGGVSLNVHGPHDMDTNCIEMEVPRGGYLMSRKRIFRFTSNCLSAKQLLGWICKEKARTDDGLAYQRRYEIIRTWLSICHKFVVYMLSSVHLDGSLDSVHAIERDDKLLKNIDKVVMRAAVHTRALYRPGWFAKSQTRRTSTETRPPEVKPLTSVLIANRGEIALSAAYKIFHLFLSLTACQTSRQDSCPARSSHHHSIHRP